MESEDEEFLAKINDTGAHNNQNGDAHNNNSSSSSSALSPKTSPRLSPKTPPKTPSKKTPQRSPRQPTHAPAPRLSEDDFERLMDYFEKTSFLSVCLSPPLSCTTAPQEKTKATGDNKSNTKEKTKRKVWETEKKKKKVEGQRKGAVQQDRNDTTSASEG